MSKNIAKFIIKYPDWEFNYILFCGIYLKMKKIFLSFLLEIDLNWFIENTLNF